MSEQKELVLKVLSDVSDTVDLFYQQKDNEAFQRFSGVLLEMTEAIDTLATYKSEHEGFEFDEQKVCSILKDAMEALQNADSVLLADVLQYDFVEYMEQIADNM
ncbi:hypothetical protein KQI69_00970 [Eubacterium sp. MSJ-13]|uniref:hypothetical protein n=1 Tax=Eubacterium sp. MSJ-13 TaxID=2841513 RepID=UPI001C118933|nr:hypothetical protein [Eubacterium sp. MSJ-13]MBU5477771.1 hypothetical protein [Eubacterium sp. MSJ-13]